MLCKYLEKKIELIPDGNEQNLQYPINLEYYLVVNDRPEVEEYDGDRVYGVEIIKKAADGNSEVRMISNLSCSKECAKEILYKLADNTVTPVGLPFILDDLIGV